MKKSVLLFAILIACKVFAQVNEIKLGASGNAYGALHANTQLWYDKDINTIAFIHRSKCALPSIKGIGYIMCDYSTDGGATWPSGQINKLLYKDTTAKTCADGIQRARYPQGVIYNPPGNTNPANAYVNSYGPIADSVNWPAHYEGTSRLGITINSQTIYPFTNSFVPEGMHIVKNTGTVWVCSSVHDKDVTIASYYDSVRLSKGISNGSDFTYTRNTLRVSFCGNEPVMSTAWSDDGQTGYVAILGNGWVCNGFPLETEIGLIVLKTVDGGTNWNETDIRHFDFVDPLLANCSCPYTAISYSIDAVVDKNNNLHAVFTIGKDLGGTISKIPGEWGVFDVYSSGNGYCTRLVAKPLTYDGSFGTSPDIIFQDTRPQASRSWDGSKLFFTWFDTDTMKYHVKSDTFPDMHSIGYDVDNDLWTSEMNFTAGTGLLSDGHCYLGSVSYYVKDSASSAYFIPATFIVYSNVGLPQNPVTNYYINNARISNFNKPSSSLCAPLSVTEKEINRVSLFPNPFTSSFTLQLTTPVENAEVTIYDILGKEMLSKKFTGDRMEIERGSLKSGVYFIKVWDGERQFVQKIIVE